MDHPPVMQLLLATALMRGANKRDGEPPSESAILRDGVEKLGVEKLGG
jgi:hypothetical protein